MFRPFTSFVLNVLEVNFDRAQGVFSPCSRYDSTVLESKFDQVLFHTAHGMFRSYWRNVSTALEVCFDHAQIFLGPWSRNVSIELEVDFDHA